MKTVAAAFNLEEALVGTFSVIVKLEILRRFALSSTGNGQWVANSYDCLSLSKHNKTTQPLGGGVSRVPQVTTATLLDVVNTPDTELSSGCGASNKKEVLPPPRAAADVDLDSLVIL